MVSQLQSTFSNQIVENSILSRNFGRETVNYFSGSPLNRLSFLRSENAFLSAAVTHASASFLLLDNLAPLTHNPSKLAYATLDEVKILIGENPFQKNEEELIRDYDSSVNSPLILFLGIDEHEQGGFEYGKYKGKPYFAVDVTPKGTMESQALIVAETMHAKGLQFMRGRLHTSLGDSEAAIYAQACALMDWNARNPFCAGCGQPTLSVSGGGKRICPPTDKASLSTNSDIPGSLSAARERSHCKTRTSISNLSFPRTDPTVITAVISHAGDRVLLGRQKRWPPNFYSTLAGFVEPGESIEEAVRREVWEESGVRVGRVRIHSTQPWPYPANLMIGALSHALPDGEAIHLENDPELEDARWFTVDELREALDIRTIDLINEIGRKSSIISIGDKEIIQGNGKNDISLSNEEKEIQLKLPPRTSIANVLLTAVLEEFLLEESKL